jgi:hypothetical protein
MSFNRDEIRFLPTNPEFASANFGINFSEIPVVQELRVSTRHPLEWPRS